MHNNKHSFSRRSWAANFLIVDWLWPNLKLIQAFTVVLITSKNVADLFKHEWLIVVIFFPILLIFECSRNGL